MNKRGVVAAILMTALVLSPLAEARRVGGGKSYGMSRSNSGSSSYNRDTSQNAGQNRQISPAQQATPAQPQRSGPGVGSMVAAGAAGAAAGYMLGHSSDARAEQTATQGTVAENGNGTIHQQAESPKSGFSWFWVAILAIAAFFIFRRFSAKKATANGNPFAPNNFGGSNTSVTNSNPSAYTGSSVSGQDNTNVFGQSVGGAFTSNGNQLADGTEPAAFLRQARAKFLHLQSMNSSSNVEEVRRYFTPEMYSAIRGEILSNDELAEFPQLTAQVIDSGSDNGQYFASVNFNGTVSESLNAQPVAFSETWHFVKASTPAGNQEWLVAGIQQN